MLNAIETCIHVQWEPLLVHCSIYGNVNTEILYSSSHALRSAIEVYYCVFVENMKDEYNELQLQKILIILSCIR